MCLLSVGGAAHRYAAVIQYDDERAAN